MKILTSLVIATFLIAAVYIGYHASQEAIIPVDAHNIKLYPHSFSIFENYYNPLNSLPV